MQQQNDFRETQMSGEKVPPIKLKKDKLIQRNQKLNGQDRKKRSKIEIKFSNLMDHEDLIDPEDMILPKKKNSSSNQREQLINMKSVTHNAASILYNLQNELNTTGLKKSSTSGLNGGGNRSPYSLIDSQNKTTQNYFVKPDQQGQQNHHMPIDGLSFIPANIQQEMNFSSSNSLSKIFMSPTHASQTASITANPKNRIFDKVHGSQEGYDQIGDSGDQPLKTHKSDLNQSKEQFRDNRDFYLTGTGNSKLQKLIPTMESVENHYYMDSSSNNSNQFKRLQLLQSLNSRENNVQNTSNINNNNFNESNSGLDFKSINEQFSKTKIFDMERSITKKTVTQFFTPGNRSVSNLNEEQKTFKDARKYNKPSPLIEQQELENIRKIMENQDNVYLKMTEEMQAPFQINITEIMKQLQNPDSTQNFGDYFSNDNNVTQNLMQSMLIRHISGATYSQNKHKNFKNSVTTGRYEVQMLEKWLDQMLLKLYSETLPLTELFKQTQVIFTAGFLQIIRQVSIQCIERASLLQQLWNSYLRLLEDSIQLIFEQKQIGEKENLDEITRVHNMYKQEIGFLTKDIQDRGEERKLDANKIEKLTQAVKYLRRQVERQDFQLMQKTEELVELQRLRRDYDALQQRVDQELSRNDETGGLAKPGYSILPSQNQPQRKLLTPLNPQIRWTPADDPIKKNNESGNAVPTENGVVNSSGHLQTMQTKQITTEIDDHQLEFRNQYLQHDFQAKDDNILVLKDACEGTLGTYSSVDKQTYTHLYSMVDTATECQIYQMDYLEGRIMDNQTQTLDIDPARDEQLKGLDVEGMGKEQDNLEKAQESLMKVIQKNPDIKSELRVEIGKFLTQTLLNQSQMRDQTIREIGLKEKYYKQKVESKIKIRQLENELDEIRKRTNILLQEHNQLGYQREQLEYEVQMRAKREIQLSHQLEQSLQQNHLFAQSKKFADNIKRSTVFGSIISAAQEDFKEGSHGSRLSLAVQKLAQSISQSSSHSDSQDQQAKKKQDTSPNKLAMGLNKRGSKVDIDRDNKKITKVIGFNFQMKAKVSKVVSRNSVVANNILAKTIQRSQQKKPQSLMLIKNLYKVIGQLYNQKIKGSISKYDPFPIFVYDFFIGHLGLKNIAEKRYIQLIQSVTVYIKDPNLVTPRLTNFAKFFKIKDQVSKEQVDFYFETIQKLEEKDITGYSIAGNANTKVMILWDRCLPLIKRMQEQLGNEVTIPVLNRLAQQKTFDQKKNAFTIDFDKLMEQVMVLQNKCVEKQKTIIDQLFYSADMDMDGSIQFYEFISLYRHIQGTPETNYQSVFQTFVNACDLINQETGDQNLSLTAFINLSLETNWFSDQKLNAFSKDIPQDEPIRDVASLQSNWEKVQFELQQRLLMADTDKYGFYTKTINKIQKFLKTNERTEMTIWLGYRILDLESKRILLNSSINLLLPNQFIIISSQYQTFRDQEENITGVDIGDDIIEFNE